MLRLGESIRRCGIAFLLLLSLCPLQKAHAVLGTLDAVPAATLLYPYFEVDLSNVNGKDTVIGLHNTSASAVLGRVTIWSNTGVPIYGFHIYLTGFDSQSFKMRDVLNGILPQTASAGQDPLDTYSPKGSASQDINFSSCNGQLPYGAVSATFVADLQAMLTGQPSTSEFSGQCVGTNAGDNVARGYVTIDVAVSCLSAPLPLSDSLYFNTYATGGQMSVQNVLIGDYMLINPAQHVLNMNNATSIEASFTDPLTTTNGNYTFYGRFVNWMATDHREPLATNWTVQGDTGSSSAIIWRDPKVSNPGGFSCAPGGKPAYAPLGVHGVRFFDRGSIFTAIQITPSVTNPFPPDIAPVATQIVPLNSAALALLPPAKMGFLDMDLNTTGPNPPVDPTAAQSLVVVLNANENRPNLSSGVIAVPTRQPQVASTIALAITTNNQFADNIALDVARVTLTGSDGNLMGGVMATFTVAAPATLVSTTCTTAGNGQCSVNIKSPTSGGYAVNVSTSTPPLAAGPLNATFVPPPVAANSTLAITTNNQLANGTALDVATVTLHDASNAAVIGAAVTFTAAAPATFVGVNTCTTNASGQCNVAIKSTTAGNFAINVTAPVALGPQNATFVPPPDPTKSTLAITTNGQLANGVAQDVATVTLHDAGNVAVNGATVTFTAAAPATLASTTCTTNASGICTVAITSTTVGSFAINVTAPIALGPQNATFN
jgi:hypothetical protein